MIRAQRAKEESSLASKSNQKMSGEDFFMQRRLEGFKDKPEHMSHQDYARQIADEWKNMSEQAQQPYHSMALHYNQQRQLEAKPKRLPTADSSTMVSVVAGTGKRKRAPKDPNAPKRNLSAFFHFCSQERPHVKGDMPNATVGDLAKELGRRWALIPSDKKAVFQKSAEKDKERYIREKAEYLAGGKPGKIPNNYVDLSANKRGPAESITPAIEFGQSDEETDEETE